MKKIPKDVAGTIERLKAEIDEAKKSLEEAKQVINSLNKQELSFKRFKHRVTIELSYLLDTEHEPMRRQEACDLFENPKLAECFQGIDLNVVYVGKVTEVPDVE